MFAVLFEVHPKPERWDDYLRLAKLMRPELERIDGFIENVRYRSLTREGWVLSLSVWRDEKLQRLSSPGRADHAGHRRRETAICQVCCVGSGNWLGSSGWTRTNDLRINSPT